MSFEQYPEHARSAKECGPAQGNGVILRVYQRDVGTEFEQYFCGSGLTKLRGDV